MPEVVTLGETMACIVPEKPGNLRYAKTFGICASGAESNVAIGLSKLGHETGWWSILGQDELGAMVQNAIRSEGVDTSRVIFRREYPTGLMLKQIRVNGETAVFYYRRGSAAGSMRPEDLDASYIQSAKILHLTGITPVLSASSLETVKEAMSMAEHAGVTISFDPNIRKKLWKSKDYSDEIRRMAFRSHIVIMGVDEAEILFGTREKHRILDLIFSRGNARYAGIKYGACGAVIAMPEEYIDIPPYPCDSVDPVGAGDGFHAAFLAGVLEGRPLDICGFMAGIAGALATESSSDTEGYPSRQKMDEILREEICTYR